MKSRGRRRVTPRVAFWALASLALLVAHDAIFLAQVGPGADLARALRSAGHGHWGATSALVAIAAALTSVVIAWRILRLRRTALSLRVGLGSAPSGRFAARVPALWGRLFVLVTIGFAIQENVEHIIGHGHLLGTGALIGPEYPLALPVIGLVTLLGAVIAAAVSVAERDLVAGIVAALARPAQRPARRNVRPPARVVVARIPLLARAGAGRAPPALSAYS